jgi:hypothetical protein
MLYAESRGNSGGKHGKKNIIVRNTTLYLTAEMFSESWFRIK